jgi:multiple sugar transport system substrate-binding protein
MKNVQRRILSAAAATVATAVILTGCATGGTTQDQPELTDEDVTLSLNWWGADARTQKTNEAIALFEEAHPNITVEPQFSDWTGYWDRLATATAAGDMPDVMQFDQLYLASYADRGTLLDLDTVANTLDVNVIPEGVLQNGLVGGTQYGLPLGGSPNAVVINKTILDQYGIDLPDTDSWTWDEFDELAQEVTDAAGGEAWGVGPFGGDTFGLTIWARQHGGNLYSEDGDVAVTPEDLTSYWQQALDWIEDGAAPPVSHIAEGIGLPLDQTDLTLGKIAMAFIPASQVSAYQAAGPGYEYILGNWPTDDDTEEGFQYLKPTQYWVASATTENPAEAALLIDFLVTDPDVAKIFGTDRGIPANPDAQEVVIPTLDEIGKQTLDFTNAMSEQVGSVSPVTPNGASDSDIILARYYQEVLFGNTSPEDAAPQFIDELQASIDAAK